MHSTSMNAIENCKNIFIWGLALNSYDAELMTMLNFAKENQNKTKKLWVINTDKNAAIRAAACTKIFNYEHIDPRNKKENN